MATINITIPDDKVGRIITAFCDKYNYQDFVRDSEETLIPNPQSKAAFVKAKVIDYIKNTTERMERQEAIRLAEQSVTSDITLS